MSIYEPVELEVLVVIAEWVDELLRHLEQSHVEEELEHREDGYVQVNVHGHPAAAHVAALVRLVVEHFLPPDHSEHEEQVRGKGHHLNNQHTIDCMIPVVYAYQCRYVTCHTSTKCLHL